MTILLALVTHGLVAVVSYRLGMAGMVKAARTWPDPPHLLEDVMHHRVDNSAETPAEGKARRNLRDNGRLSVILILAGLFVIVIGAQAYVDGRDNRADQRRIDAAVSRLEDTTVELENTITCVRAWGEEFATVTTNRVGAGEPKGTVDLENAVKRRDQALDQIILTVVAFRQIPPTADDDDFDRVLREYVASIRHLESVRTDVGVTRELNQYPKLDCPIE